MDLKIDPEFEQKIPPLTDEEFALLEENILSDGEIRDPLVVWNGYILDGHNRFRIHKKHPEIPVTTHESLRSMFSKKERRGSQPPKTFRSGGKIIRELVIQLKAKEYIDNYGKNEEEATDHGLYLTRTGRSELDKIAAGLMKK